ncbi:MAG: trypsin-like peptidase domain-containing protein, partial [Anaerolineae bacterium]|nr:trypsin-like peptidase domain-containing protein [Anaerolineae bacterium]
DVESQILIEVYRKVNPSVVNVTNLARLELFAEEEVIPQGEGSGFVWDDQGHIVTNAHVVEGADEVQVTLYDGLTFPAQVIGVDPDSDLAVVKIDPQGLELRPVELGDIDEIVVGQRAIAIGNPFGFEGTLTQGAVSAIGRTIPSLTDFNIPEAIQTDAAINPGNSGGPLLDLRGHVIGVNAQIISPSRASAGIGFAVSSNTVRRVAPELIAQRRYPHPWLGATLASFNAQGAQILREAGMDVPVDEGLLVMEIVPGGPAEVAGIRGSDQVVRFGRTPILVGGDIIIAVNGAPTTDFKELTVYLELETQVGDTVEITLIRDGQQMTVPLTLAERPQ